MCLALGFVDTMEPVDYNKDTLDILQNLSFLVNKPNGDHRLLTSFGELGKFSKPQPSLMPNVDSVLRSIRKWKYIIVTDLLKSFYQIPLAKSYMKYCRVITPFKGNHVYTRCAMGMPGSVTYLEELMYHVVDHPNQEGCVAKTAVPICRRCILRYMHTSII